MSNVKLAVIYYSMGGTNYQLAQWAAEGGKEAGAEVKILKVRELAPQSIIEKNPIWKAHVEATSNISEATPEDLEWADAIIFSSPTRFGVMASQMKQFLDLTGGLWAQGKTVNKVVSAMSSAQNPHGGQEATILSIYTQCSIGGNCCSSWFYRPSCFRRRGNPYGTSVSVDQDGKMVENVQAAVKHQAKRTVTVADWIKKGINNFINTMTKGDQLW